MAFFTVLVFLLASVELGLCDRIRDRRQWSREPFPPSPPQYPLPLPPAPPPFANEEPLNKEPDPFSESEPTPPFNPRNSGRHSNRGQNNGRQQKNNQKPQRRFLPTNSNGRRENPNNQRQPPFLPVPPGNNTGGPDISPIVLRFLRRLFSGAGQANGAAPDFLKEIFQGSRPPPGRGSPFAGPRPGSNNNPGIFELMKLLSGEGGDGLLSLMGMGGPGVGQSGLFEGLLGFGGNKNSGSETSDEKTKGINGEELDGDDLDMVALFGG